jgi:hypothetical protein
MPVAPIFWNFLLPALRELAAKAERAAPAGRGFGLVPAIDLSRAAQNAIRQIESR